VQSVGGFADEKRGTGRVVHQRDGSIGVKACDVEEAIYNEIER
jgi:hypothetical protein